MPLFGPKQLKRFQYLSLSARRLGGSPLLASPRKKLLGGGTEVTGHRDYAPGDCFSHIDWMRCAHRDELVLKLFEGEADRHIHILLDRSPSMALGSPAKFQLARQIAAALGYVSLLNLDRLTVAAFADGLAADLPPLRHQSRANRLFQFLAELSPGGKRTDLTRTIQEFLKRPQRPGPVIVISDLYDPDGFQASFDRLRFHGYEPRIVQIVDPREVDPGMLGDVELADIESGAVRQATVTKRSIRRYRELLADFQQSVREYCARKSITFMRIACDAAVDDVFVRVLGAIREDTPAEASSP